MVDFELRSQKCRRFGILKLIEIDGYPISLNRGFSATSLGVISVEDGMALGR